VVTVFETAYLNIDVEEKLRKKNSFGLGNVIVMCLKQRHLI